MPTYSRRNQKVGKEKYNKERRSEANNRNFVIPFNNMSFNNNEEVPK